MQLAGALAEKPGVAQVGPDRLLRLGGDLEPRELEERPFGQGRRRPLLRRQGQHALEVAVHGVEREAPGVPLVRNALLEDGERRASPFRGRYSSDPATAGECG